MNNHSQILLWSYKIGYCACSLCDLYLGVHRKALKIVSSLRAELINSISPICMEDSTMMLPNRQK